LYVLATVVRLAGPGGVRAVVAESALVKQQLLILNRSDTITTLRQQPRRYMQYDNHQRLHLSLGFQSPVDYEQGAA